MGHSMMRWKFCFALFGLVMMIVSAVIPAQASSPDSVVPRFEKADCKFDVPAGRSVQCGYLIVPEDRSAPGKRTIRLHVGIFKAGAKSAADPIVFLDGGPGGHSLEAMTKVRALEFFDQVTAGRDLILFDQRG